MEMVLFQEAYIKKNMVLSLKFFLDASSIFSFCLYTLKCYVNHFSIIRSTFRDKGMFAPTQ